MFNFRSIEALLIVHITLFILLIFLLTYVILNYLNTSTYFTKLKDCSVLFLNYVYDFLIIICFKIFSPSLLATPSKKVLFVQPRR